MWVGRARKTGYFFSSPKIDHLGPCILCRYYVFKLNEECLFPIHDHRNWATCVYSTTQEYHLHVCYFNLSHYPCKMLCLNDVSSRCCEQKKYCSIGQYIFCFYHWTNLKPRYMIFFSKCLFTFFKSEFLAHL